MIIVIEEVNNTLFWIEIMQKKANYDTLHLNWKEGAELTAIVGATKEKVKAHLNDLKP
jgi:hypothetical protein